MASNVAHIAAQVERLTGRFTERLAEDQPVHFVGHSLGGIMIMQTLAQHPVANVGRVVMVGTPFQGSAPANNLQKRRWGQAVLGKTIVEWAGVKAENLPPGLQVGTIAGTRAFGMGSVFTRLQHPHDGTVSLAETHVPFATDRLTLHVTHTEMLMSSAVTAPMARFLHTAKFSIGQ
jgi:pimeloyl-ACP methyl ester carboxylesterase